MLTQENATKTLTVAEFIALPKDGNRYELVEGELVIKGSKTRDESLANAKVAARLTYHLVNYVDINDLGEVYSSEARYETVSETSDNKATVRIPDISFVQTSRLVAEDTSVMPFAPDLAVEGLGQTDGYEEMEDKVTEYFGRGGRLVWVINIWKREVYVYRPDQQDRKTFLISNELDGGGVLPGFKLKVQSIFEKVRP
jgi:Uma2 family endonuclease